MGANTFRFISCHHNGKTVIYESIAGEHEVLHGVWSSRLTIGLPSVPNISSAYFIHMYETNPAYRKQFATNNTPTDADECWKYYIKHNPDMITKIMIDHSSVYKIFWTRSNDKYHARAGESQTLDNSRHIFVWETMEKIYLARLIWAGPGLCDLAPGLAANLIMLI